MKQQIKAYTDRYRFPSKVVASVYRFILLLKYIAQNPLAYLRYRTHFHIIAGPGSLGFKGGLFNPGAVNTAYGDTVMLAKGQAQHWMLAQGENVHEYFTGAPVFMSFDKHHRVKESCEVQNLYDFPVQDDLEIEDFRLFRFENQIWVNHNIIQVERTAHQTGYMAAMVCLSHLDSDNKSLTFQGYPQLDFDIQKKEKNWVFTEFNGDLYLFYSFHPYRVLKLIDRQTLTFSTMINQPLGSQLSDIGGYGTFVSYSTNPVDYDEQHLLLLIHQVDPKGMGRLYYHWGVLIDKVTMYPAKITAAPLFSGIGARGLLRGVIYVMSVIAQQDTFLFYCGEGDTYLSRTQISKDKLDSLWMEVEVPRSDLAPQLV
ncbi:MAG: hypothetical protein ETSY2_22540 [Candidatus Entotheonella gemina]|uniref:Uncharacterized protein n=1 Tax=Candidatus Entotheonella gemina TaxID=1429439 RepID=W4M5M3_9BACT|nr:MAG: hypothetical protein ETSY2_22540 [Candidatus Entotheonella gemina]